MNERDRLRNTIEELRASIRPRPAADDPNVKQLYTLERQARTYEDTTDEQRELHDAVRHANTIIDAMLNRR